MNILYPGYLSGLQKAGFQDSTFLFVDGASRDIGIWHSQSEWVFVTAPS